MSCAISKIINEEPVICATEGHTINVLVNVGHIKPSRELCIIWFLYLPYL
jgi:hypothetical protein